MNKLIYFLSTIFLFGACSEKTSIDSIKIPGTKNPEISLNGTWNFSMDPPDEFWLNTTQYEGWPDIIVPGECQMQGFAIKYDTPYAYKTEIQIPRDYKGKSVFLTFDGVYSHAKVWVNGKFIREHHGGFTRWKCDITNHVSAGDSAVLTVEFTDRTDDISFGSGYAKHPIGGILGDVKLSCLPEQHFRQLYFETDLDEKYKNAELKIFYQLSQDNPVTIKAELFDKDNQLVKSSTKNINSLQGNFSMMVEDPLKWDAEHPNLYTVLTTLIQDGQEILKIPEKIGFREVTVQGNKLLLNGKPVKLRGACRHEIHPLKGRMTTPEYDKLDVLLAKEANINFIRTSHYPPSETFLEFCDQYGIYVEDETAICFVNDHRPEPFHASGASYDNPEFTDRYLSQLEEMVNNHRNHPSIIIWSIGNESTFGSNFVKSYEWVKKADQTRPVIFSYPGIVPDSVKIYDILSMHYPKWTGDLEQFGISTRGFEYKDMPVIFDEWAHIACYNNYELKNDPNVRNFWGQSLDSMWTLLFESEGGLGGAIWGMIDETFMLPDTLEGFGKSWGVINTPPFPSAFNRPVVGYGEWGIADTWRRKKPEFWLTKKAYSPTKIMVKKITNPEKNKKLEIPVHNRFDHTNFSELNIIWKNGKLEGAINDLDIGPHKKGKIVIPANSWDISKPLSISFYKNDTFLVDSYNLQLSSLNFDPPKLKKGELNITENKNQISVTGENISFIIDKEYGIIRNAMVNNDTVIKSGPFINLKFPETREKFPRFYMHDYAANWICNDFDFSVEDGIATVSSGGKYDSISAKFTIKIDTKGLFYINYHIDEIPPWKKIEESGIKFIVGSSFSKLSWNRDSYFTAYPENHPGRPTGEIDLDKKPTMNYREKPGHPWEMDTKSFYYYGLNNEMPYTNVVRSMKGNIYSYVLKTRNNSKVEVLSNGSKACRFDKIDEENTLFINDIWDYTALGWGNYMKLIESGKEQQGKVIIRLN